MVASELTGQRFGRLTALKITGQNKHQINLWLCRCECGNTKEVASYNLKKGHTRSCGCLQKDVVSKIPPETVLTQKQAGNLLNSIRYNGYNIPKPKDKKTVISGEKQSEKKNENGKN